MAQVTQFKSGISYWPFDLGQVAQADPDLFEVMLSAVMSEFSAEGLKPIPLTVFGGKETADAFQTMARAKHIGKIVISLAGRTRGLENLRSRSFAPTGPISSREGSGPWALRYRAGCATAAHDT